LFLKTLNFPIQATSQGFLLETIMSVQMVMNSARNQTPIATFFPYSKLFETNLVGQKVLPQPNSCINFYLLIFLGII
jgi:hypothetical protein